MLRMPPPAHITAEPTDSDTVLTTMREIAAAEAIGTVDITAEQLRELLHRNAVSSSLPKATGPRSATSPHAAVTLPGTGS